jgi:hypothetical protein
LSGVLRFVIPVFRNLDTVLCRNADPRTS